MNRVSIREGSFKVGTYESKQLNCIIVNASTLQRMLYLGDYKPESPQTPVCWSSDAKHPDPQVKNKQAARCMDCKHNVRGSAPQFGRACRYSQKLAVVMEDNLYEIYQLHVPANSIFGRALNGDLPLQAYARFLSSNDTDAVSVYTKVHFDSTSVVPKLFFAPVRSLEQCEAQTIKEVINHPDALEAITLDFSNVQETVSPFEKTEGFTIST
jgi:hypothetical protein